MYFMAKYPFTSKVLLSLFLMYVYNIWCSYIVYLPYTAANKHVSQVMCRLLLLKAHTSIEQLLNNKLCYICS